MLTQLLRLCIMVSYVNATLTVPEVENFTSFSAIFNLIECQFRHQYSTLAITGIINDLTQDLVAWAMRNYHDTPTIVASAEQIHATYQQGVLANVVVTVVSDIHDVKNALELLTKYQFFSHQSHVFFVWTKPNRGAFLLAEINEYIWKNNILNFYIVSYSDTLRLVGYNPFKEEKIEVLTKPESYLQMFKNKVKQLNGYEIRGGTVEDVPRAVYNRGKVQALDVIALESIFARLNGSLTVVYYPSASSKTIKKALKQGKIDFAMITQFLQNSEIVTEKKFLYTYPYVLDGVIILVPIPKHLPGYLNIFYIFESKLWLCIVVTSLVLTILILILDTVSIKKFSVPNREGVFFQILRVMVNLPSAEVKRAIAAKKLAFVFCLWFSFFFGVLFQSSLTSTLIKPKSYPKLNTLKELSLSKYKIYVFSPSFATPLSTWKMLESSFVFTDKTEILQMIMEGNDVNAYMCNSFESANIYIERTRNKFRKHLFYILEEPFVPGHRAYLFLQHSPFLHTVNKYLLMYREFGIRRYKFGTAQVQKTLIPENSVIDSPGGTGHVDLDVTHLQTVFFVLILGLSVSMLVFVSELVWRRLERNSDIKKKRSKKKIRLEFVA